MKKSFIQFLFFSILLILISCSKDQEVKSLSLSLVKDLEIGALEGDENYLFASIIDVEIDSQENIYVLDWKNKTVKKYDKNGIFIQNIGQQGQGPGEFSAILVDSFVDINDKLYVVELLKVHVFDQNGGFLYSFIPDFFPRGIIVDRKGNIILVGEKKDKIFHVYDQNGRYIESFGELFLIPEIMRKYLGNKKKTYSWIFHVLNEGQLLAFHPYKYEIDVYQNNELIRKISRNSPYYESPKKAKNEKGEDVYLTTWTKILESEKYLFIWYGAEMEDYILGEERYIDIFDKKDFTFLKTVTITEKGMPEIVLNNCMYFYNNDDETDFPKITKYRIILF